MSKEKEITPANETSVVGFDQTFIDLIKQISKLTNKIINKPTTKEKVFPICFVIDKQKVNDIFDTIETKVADYTTDEREFSINVLYSDKSYVPFPSFNDFMTDHETKPICARNVQLKWNMKIFFNGRHNPLVAKIGEEHTIEINITVAPDEAGDADRAYFIFNGYPVESRGVVQVSVKHSNKVWADEIIQHVQDYVDRIKISNANQQRFVYKYKQTICKLVEMLFDLTPVVPLMFLMLNFNNSINTISIVVRYLSLSFFLFIISQIFSFSLGKRLFKYLGKEKSTSWIILNEYTKSKYDSTKIKTNT